MGNGTRRKLALICPQLSADPVKDTRDGIVEGSRDGICEGEHTQDQWDDVHVCQME